MREYLRVNLTYYTTIILTILFFWEWFWTLNPDSETGEAVTSHMVYFPIVTRCSWSYAWPRAATCGTSRLMPADEAPGMRAFGGECAG